MPDAIIKRPIPSPGIMPGVPFGDYCSWDALNFHTLMHYERSAMYARWRMAHGDEETPSLQLGDAAHAAVFQPEVFSSKYVCVPDFGDLRFKANKERKAEWETKAPRDMILTPNDEYYRATGVREAIARHPIASELLLTSEGGNEISFAWDQEGFRCKGRIDRICRYRGEIVVADLKTTRNPWHDTFVKDCVNFQYPAQMGTYRGGLGRLNKARRQFALVAIQNEEPYEIAVYWVSEEDLAKGENRFESWLRTHKQCLADGVWPAAVSEAELVLPKWAWN